MRRVLGEVVAVARSPVLFVVAVIGLALWTAMLPIDLLRGRRRTLPRAIVRARQDDNAAPRRRT